MHIEARGGRREGREGEGNPVPSNVRFYGVICGSLVMAEKEELQYSLKDLSLEGECTHFGED